MSNGTLAVWSGIDADTEDDYNAWYEREHMFERIEVPGIRRARHYRTVSGRPRFFTYFELADPSVVASGVYFAQTNNPSPWTQRILPHFREVNRTASRVIRRVGKGFGAAAMTVRHALEGGEDKALAAWLADTYLPEVVTRPGVIAGQLWQADIGASRQPGQDRNLRPEEDSISDLTLFVEATETGRLEELSREPQLVEALARARTISAPLVAVHQLLNGAETDEAPTI
jgi:hypothetical protein